MCLLLMQHSCFSCSQILLWCLFRKWTYAATCNSTKSRGVIFRKVIVSVCACQWFLWFWTCCLLKPLPLFPVNSPFAHCTYICNSQRIPILQEAFPAKRQLLGCWWQQVRKEVLVSTHPYLTGRLKVHEMFSVGVELSASFWQVLS